MNPPAAPAEGLPAEGPAAQAAIRASGLLDPDWYRAQYPDVDMTGLDPVVHYLRYGARLGRDPGPLFRTVLYRDLHPEAERDGANPLVHYLQTRKRTGQAPAPDPGRVLWAAARLEERGDPAHALAVAKTLLPAELAHTLPILHANTALEDETAWCMHLNRYLAHFGIAPVRLRPDGASRFLRLTCETLPAIDQGPCVSVIMPAWNAEATVSFAAHSILGQTWRPLELIIVDDASTDGTWAALRAIAAQDSRVKLLRNPVNVGPYVSKNRALALATGRFVTGHDADDWAHPERIARHLAAVLPTGGYIEASLSYMIRVRADGRFAHFEPVCDFSPDGVTRVSSISCLFEARLLREELGHWDCVRFGGDTEMISRTRQVLGPRFAELPQLGMICLDSESNLTNDPLHGIRPKPGAVPTRRIYRDAWRAWHRTLTPGSAWLDFPPLSRPFKAPEAAAVPPEAVLAVLQTGIGPLEYAGGDAAARPSRPLRQRPTVDLPVADLATKLWSGFSTPAAADLQNLLVDTARSPEDRANAAWHLARWAALEEDWETCLRHLDALGATGTSLAADRRVRVLAQDARIRAGHQNEVIHALQSDKQLARDTNSRIAYMNALLRAGRKDPAAAAGTEAKRLEALARLYTLQGLAPVALANPAAGLRFGNLRADAAADAAPDQPKISVLMAVHNSEDFLETAVRAMLDQTWRNLEIIAVDDASTDASWDILQHLAVGDGRLRILRNTENNGAYGTRNRALAEATGDLITVHDSDDWSHPQMLEQQASALFANPALRGTFSVGARVLPDLEVMLRPERDALSYLHRSYPSLLMRRADVARLGGWDGVRASADDEFVERIRTLWGREALADVLPGTPLSLFLRHENSLTHRKGTQLRTLTFGIRQEYSRQAAFWRERNAPPAGAEGFPLERRGLKEPFPIPQGLAPKAWRRPADYDLVIVSDLSLSGGTRRCNEGYIAAASALGWRVGLFHWPRYDLVMAPDIAADYREMSYRENIDILVREDSLRCARLIIHHPPILKYRLDAVPRMDVERLIVLANQSPKQTWRAAPEYYFPHQVSALCRELFDREPVWAPISPTIRRIFTELGGYTPMTKTDWYPPLGRKLADAGFPARPATDGNRLPVIGRHSRDHWSKWPAHVADIGQAYCAGTDIRVRLMGGARQASRALRGMPANWETIGFDAMPVRDFLGSLDFFVNFIHEDSVEAFGRNVMEAMAAGVPTILSPSFRETFGEAALYCTPADVADTVRHVFADPARYDEIARRGYAFVQMRCDERVVRQRLENA